MLLFIFHPVIMDFITWWWNDCSQSLSPSGSAIQRLRCSVLVPVQSPQGKGLMDPVCTSGLCRCSSPQTRSGGWSQREDRQPLHEPRALMWGWGAGGQKEREWVLERDRRACPSGVCSRDFSESSWDYIDEFWVRTSILPETNNLKNSDWFFSIQSREPRGKGPEILKIVKDKNHWLTSGIIWIKQYFFFLRSGHLV